MDFFQAIDVAASGLSAERTRMNVAASNLANASTTRTAEGGPYRPQSVVLSSEAKEGAGPGEVPVFEVKGAEVVDDGSAPRIVHDPAHPDADADGNVAYPNVNVVEEMVDMITASRAYEAGLGAVKSAVAMAESAIGIGR
jgi:flagellar basal-body rod protein FlgC